MKTSFFVKLFLVLPVVVFADYVAMSVMGATASIMGAGDDFYCGTYCFIGKGVLLLSAMFFIYILFPNLKQFFKQRLNAQAHTKP